MSEADLPIEISLTAEEEASARYKFLLWFAEPFRILEERGEGQGGFAALSIGLFLCERYFRYKSGTLDIWPDKALLEEAAKHFEMDSSFFREFWGVYRHGMLHQGTPLASGDFGWDVSDEYPAAPTRAFEKGKAIICVNPWAFTAEMIVLCWSDPVALTRISDQALGCSGAGPLKWELVK